MSQTQQEAEFEQLALAYHTVAQEQERIQKQISSLVIPKPITLDGQYYSIEELTRIKVEIHANEQAIQSKELDKIGLQRQFESLEVKRTKAEEQLDKFLPGELRTKGKDSIRIVSNSSHPQGGVIGLVIRERKYHIIVGLRNDDEFDRAASTLLMRLK